LSGLFYVADKHFDLFFEESKRSRERAETAVEGMTEDRGAELNLDTLTAYLQRRFEGRSETGSALVSKLLLDLTSAGYTQIRDLDDLVARTSSALAPSKGGRHPAADRYSSIALLRKALASADKLPKQGR
jgi:hypothetical protein